MQDARASETPYISYYSYQPCTPYDLVPKYPTVIGIATAHISIATVVISDCTGIIIYVSQDPLAALVCRCSCDLSASLGEDRVLTVVYLGIAVFGRLPMRWAVSSPKRGQLRDAKHSELAT